MGRKRTPGLYKRGEFWHVDKKIGGYRLCESTGAIELEDAEKYLAHRVEEIRQAAIYGVRQKHLFREACAKYLLENQHKKSIGDDAMHFKFLDQYVGQLSIDQIHNGSLQPFIEKRLAEGRKTKTINLALGSLRHMLNLAASEWIDEQGLTWLQTAPKIKLLSIKDARGPYPLSWEEQNKLFEALPDHLREMALYKVNTGCREQEVCLLSWAWEIPLPELNTSVFIIPGTVVKNKDDRLVVLNKIAKEVVDRQRGKHSSRVFSYYGKPLSRMNNSAWKQVRKKVGLKQVRVHDLKHTFGRRLRAAGVSFEDRQDLLGHRSARITTHYSAAELHQLIAAANKVCDQGGQKQVLTLMRLKSDWQSMNTGLIQAN